MSERLRDNTHVFAHPAEERPRVVQVGPHILLATAVPLRETKQLTSRSGVLHAIEEVEAGPDQSVLLAPREMCGGGVSAVRMKVWVRVVLSPQEAAT